MDAGKPRLVGVEVELDLRRFWGDSRRSWGRPRTAGRRGGPGHRAPGVLFRGFQLSPFPSSGSARSSCLETISKLQPGAALGRAPRAPGAARGSRRGGARGEFRAETTTRRSRAKKRRARAFWLDDDSPEFFCESSEGPGRAYEKVGHKNEVTCGRRPPLFDTATRRRELCCSSRAGSLPGAQGDLAGVKIEGGLDEWK